MTAGTSKLDHVLSTGVPCSWKVLVVARSPSSVRGAVLSSALFRHRFFGVFLSRHVHGGARVEIILGLVGWLVGWLVDG